ncbi:MAG: hypothetical protein RIC80_18750 [Cyclobacteriaceae bacterium]
MIKNLKSHSFAVLVLITSLQGYSQPSTSDSSTVFDFSQAIKIIDHGYFDKSEDFAEIFLYRTNSFYAIAVDFNMNLDNEVTCLLKNNSYFRVQVEPGPYPIKGKNQIEINAEPGESYYVEAKVAGFAKLNLKYRLVNDREAQIAINKARVVECENIEP